MFFSQINRAIDSHKVIEKEPDLLAMNQSLGDLGNEAKEIVKPDFINELGGIRFI